jgi:hypothetical protein
LTFNAGANRPLANNFVFHQIADKAPGFPLACQLHLPKRRTRKPSLKKTNRTLTEYTGDEITTRRYECCCVRHRSQFCRNRKQEKGRARQLRRKSVGEHLRSTSSVAEFTFATLMIGLRAECGLPEEFKDREREITQK